VATIKATRFPGSQQDRRGPVALPGPSERTPVAPARRAKTKNPLKAAKADYTVEPPQDGERYVELRRVGQGK